MPRNSSTPTLLTLTALIAAPFAFANTPLLINTDFAELTGDNVGWSTGSNSFIGGAWQSYISDAYTLDDRVDPSGTGFVFSSWDDGASDTLENFLFQEFAAGPTTNVTFSEGDKIVFKGSASATRTGADTSDMKVRAFVKTLGYNDLGWANQIQDNYTTFHDITSTLEPFEISITFPDATTADPFQLVQIGFEISNSYDSAAKSMDAGTIYFENFEAYIEGDAPEMWKGFEVLTSPDGWVDTGTDNLGWVYIRNDPLIFSDSLGSWFFIESSADFEGTGNWLYVFKN